MPKKKSQPAFWDKTLAPKRQAQVFDWGEAISLQQVEAACFFPPPNTRTVHSEANRQSYSGDEHATWETALAQGKSYLMGDVPMAQYLRQHRSQIPAWMRPAVAWAHQHPDRQLVVESSRFFFTIGVRGEYVQIGLPHQDHGGEKWWATRDGKSRVLVNED